MGKGSKLLEIATDRAKRNISEAWRKGLSHGEQNEAEDERKGWGLHDCYYSIPNL